MKFNHYRLYLLSALCCFALVACGDKTAPPPTATTTTIPEVAPDLQLGATPEPDTDPAAMANDQAETSAALFKVANLIATENGGDPVALAQFCDQNAHGFANVTEVKQCKELGGPAALLPVPKTSADVIKLAATLPVQSRFELCTSDRALSLFKGDDYDRCFPKSAQDEAAKLGGIKMSGGGVQVSPMAIQDQIVTNSSRMSPRERKAYCYTAGVLEAFDNDPASCLNGEIPLTDDDPGYRDTGH